MGYFPWFLHQRKGYIEPSDIVLYHKSLINMAPSVLHVPLFKDNFNVCRSNIAFIEGVNAGAACVIPDFWGELPGAIRYSNPSEYKEAIKSCCEGHIDIEKKNAQSWSYVKDNLRLNKINKLRISLLKNL